MNARRNSLLPNDLVAYAVASPEMNAVRAFAHRQNLQLKRRYCETINDARGPLFRRPKLIRLFADVRSHSITRLALHSWENLAIDPAICSDFLEYLHDLQVSLLFVKEGRLPERRGSRDAAKTTSREVKLFKQAVTRKGNGTKLGRRSLATSEDKVTVDRILHLARSLPKDKWKIRARYTITRRSPNEIAKELENEGCARSNGKRWTDDAVRTVLKQLRPDWML